MSVGAHSVQQRVTDPVDVVSICKHCVVLGTKFKSSPGEVSTLKHSAISLAS